MNILALDTSTTYCTISIFNSGLQEDHQVTGFVQQGQSKQTQFILPTIRTLLSQVNLSIRELDVIAYGRGPGSFTGVRVAATIGKALGLALNLPVITLSSLGLIAETARLNQGIENAIIVQHARTQEVNWAQYQDRGERGMTLIGEERCTHPEDIRIHKDQLSLSENTYALGDGWLLYPDQLHSSLGFSLPSLPFQGISPQALISLTKIQYLNSLSQY